MVAAARVRPRQCGGAGRRLAEVAARGPSGRDRPGARASCGQLHRARGAQPDGRQGRGAARDRRWRGLHHQCAAAAAAHRRRRQQLRPAGPHRRQRQLASGAPARSGDEHVPAGRRTARTIRGGRRDGQAGDQLLWWRHRGERGCAGADHAGPQGREAVRCFAVGMGEGSGTADGNRLTARWRANGGGTVRMTWGPCFAVRRTQHRL